MVCVQLSGGNAQEFRSFSAKHDVPIMFHVLHNWSIMKDKMCRTTASAQWGI